MKSTLIYIFGSNATRYRPLQSSAMTEEENPISEDSGSHSSPVWLGMWVALSASREEVVKAPSAEEFLILL